MSNLRQKVAVYLGLAEDEEYDGYDYERSEDRTQQPERSTGRSAADPVAVRQQPTAAFAPARSRRIEAAYDIVRYSPSAYSDVATIGESFRSGDAVTMDLTGLTTDDAKRMIDFASGLTFGLKGSIERVHGKIFLLTPSGVEIADSVRSSLTAAV